MLFGTERLLCFKGCFKRGSLAVTPSDTYREHRFRDGLYQSYVSLGILSLFIHSGLYLTLPTILYPQLNIDQYQNAWIAGFYSVGGFIGCFLLGPMSDTIGRKPTAIFSALLAATAWASTYCLPENFELYLLYLIRFLSGIAMALKFVAIPYVSEVTNKHWRPVFLAMASVFLASGVLIAATIGVLIPWRSFALVGLIISLWSIASLVTIPESPHWLLRANPEDAKQALMKLNKNKQDFEEEWSAMAVRWSEQERNKSHQARFLSREVRRPMSRLAILFFFQQFGGVYVVMVNALQVFSTVTRTTRPSSDSGPTDRLPNLTDPDSLCFIVIGTMRIIMAGLTVLTTKHINNRLILITSAVGGAASAFVFAAVFAGFFGPVKDVVPLGLILLFHLFLSYGMMVLPWAQIGELIPLSYRAKGSGLIVAYANVLTFVTMKGFPYAMDWVGLGGVFVFFGVVSTLASIFVYFYIPETRGKTFAEIEEYFK